MYKFIFSKNWAFICLYEDKHSRFPKTEENEQGAVVRHIMTIADLSINSELMDYFGFTTFGLLNKGDRAQFMAHFLSKKGLDLKPDTKIYISITTPKNE